MQILRLDSARGFEVWRDVSLAGGDDNARARTVHRRPGQPARAQRDQWLYVISGEGWTILDGEERAIREGDLLPIEAGEAHEIFNDGEQPLETLNIYAPPGY